MIFEKLDYQQNALENILTLLKGFDFKSLKISNVGGGGQK